MKILYVAMEYDYGDPARGLSFEQTNFKSTLDAMGHEVVQFDFMARARAVGRSKMRSELIHEARAQDPHLVFFFLFGDEIDASTISQVGSSADAPTVNWFADDHWRFERFTSRIAPSLDWCVTTDRESLEQYRQLGVENVILSQWACNQHLYRPSQEPIQFGVTFVGQPHGDRREIVKAIRKAGIEVTCWGHGWSGGRLGHDEMVRVFGTSAINLNLSNASTDGGSAIQRVRRRLAGQGPGAGRPQIKGRTFEVPGCAGFELTESVPHLGDYFEIGSEIATFTDRNSLIDRIRYWLTHDDERGAVAEAGYRRVVSDHTYDLRFNQIFERIGLDTGI